MKLIKNILMILSDKDEVLESYNSKYNLIAYPFSDKYQNSNGWLLEILVRSMALKDGKDIDTHKEFIEYI